MGVRGFGGGGVSGGQWWSVMSEYLYHFVFQLVLGCARKVGGAYIQRHLRHAILRAPEEPCG